MLRQAQDTATAKNLEDILQPATLAALKTLETRKVYPQEYEFFTQGERPSGVYILYAGRVRLSTTHNAGGRLILGFVLPGDILGLSAAVSGERHKETAEATTPCQAGFISCTHFLRFLDQHPEAAFWVVQLLSGRVTIALDHLSSFRGEPHRKVMQ